MEAATNPNNTNYFPNSLPLHIYKSILLFIAELPLHASEQERIPPPSPFRKSLKRLFFSAFLGFQNFLKQLNLCV